MGYHGSDLPILRGQATGEGLRLRYRELAQQAEEDLSKEKHVAHPEIDLTVILCNCI